MTELPIPSHEVMIRQPEWAKLTFEQLQKDANLCAIDWPEANIPSGYEQWISFIYERLVAMNSLNPELLPRFLYRIDLPEKTFLQHPLPSIQMAESILKREFMKVWFKSQFKSQ
jgi:hypothetical protein